MKSIEQAQNGSRRASVETVVEGNTKFALDLYQILRTMEGNIFFSPYSISTALAMTYAGARGSTESQMANVLRFLLEQEQLHPAFAWLEASLRDVEKKGRIQLSVANSLWPHKRLALLDEFLALTKRYYGVQITVVDYGRTEEARRMINAWVEDKTENKIEELILPRMVDSSTDLVLVNAIYFKGDWANQFDEQLTHEAPFSIAPDKQVQVMMMTQKHEFRYAESGDLQVLELPYAGEDLSMLVLLPAEVGGLADLEDRLSVENLERWTKYLWETKVRVFLPRFELTLPIQLGETLKSMGMPDAFSGGADFSGMAKGQLFISEVVHKAFVKVNEEGTEAAAATAVIMGRGAPPPVPTFRADHPFLFLIRENTTGSILFVGRVVDPTSKAD
jgi:serpin B